MSITPYLDDLDVDPEAKRVLGVALASAIPTCYARAQSSNYAGICTETNTGII